MSTKENMENMIDYSLPQYDIARHGFQDPQIDMIKSISNQEGCQFPITSFSCGSHPIPVAYFVGLKHLESNGIGCDFLNTHCSFCGKTYIEEPTMMPGSAETLFWMITMYYNGWGFRNVFINYLQKNNYNMPIKVNLPEKGMPRVIPNLYNKEQQLNCFFESCEEVANLLISKFVQTYFNNDFPNKLKETAFLIIINCMLIDNVISADN
jgi:hypothetical protein